MKHNILLNSFKIASRMNFPIKFDDYTVAKV